VTSTANIRAAIASTLQTALGSTWGVSGYFLSKPEPPQIDLLYGPVVYDTAMRGGNHDVKLVLRATVQWGEATSAQQALDGLMDSSGSSSLKAALEADKTLGGTIDYIRVTEVSEPKVYPTAGSDVVGVEFTVEVGPSG